MMRLIDADALPKFTGMALSAVDVARAVENAPTIDPVKHGKWVEHAWEWHKCSVCGTTAVNDDEGYEYLTPYCPYCGASMERSEE